MMEALVIKRMHYHKSIKTFLVGVIVENSLIAKVLLKDVFIDGLDATESLRNDPPIKNRVYNVAFDILCWFQPF